MGIDEVGINKVGIDEVGRYPFGYLLCIDSYECSVVCGE